MGRGATNKGMYVVYCRNGHKHRGSPGLIHFALHRRRVPGFRISTATASIQSHRVVKEVMLSTVPCMWAGLLLIITSQPSPPIALLTDCPLSEAKSFLKTLSALVVLLKT